MEAIHPAVKTPQQHMQERLAKFPHTLAALSHIEKDQQWKYAAAVVLFFLHARDSWPRYADYGLSIDVAKRVRRTVTTTLMADLDTQE